jgi:hypothetical protein
VSEGANCDAGETSSASAYSKSAFLEHAKALVASHLDDPDLEHLTEPIGRLLAGWMDNAAAFQRNTDYYRGLVRRCGVLFGKRAFTSNDGGVQNDVLFAKVPELVEECINDMARYRDALKKIAEQDYRGNPPVERQIAWDALEKGDHVDYRKKK